VTLNARVRLALLWVVFRVYIETGIQIVTECFIYPYGICTT